MIKPKAIIESNRRYVLIPGAEDDGLLDSATLNLDFTGGQLDSRIDFQRTTVGTYYRGAFNQNLVTQSETFSGWFFDGITAANSSEQNPTNAGTAYGITETATTGNHRFGRTGLTVQPSSYVTTSAYLKAGLRTLVGIYNNQLSNTTVTFELTGSGSFGAIPANALSASITPVGNGWYRCSVTHLSATNGTFSAFLSGCTGTLSSPTNSYAGNASAPAIYAWGVQVTEGTLLTPYIPTTTAAITEGQIASSQPWNLLLRSQEFDNTTSWANAIGGTGVNPVRTANNAVAPDGTTTADTITFNTGANTTTSDFSFILQSITFTAGREYTLSFWVRGTVGGEKLTVRHLSGGAYTLVTASTSWQRISITETAASGGNIQIGIRQNISGHGVINSTATVELWGAQVNEGSSALDYRSTTSSALWLPRFENDPVTGEARGLLIEGGATNLLQQSENLFTSWTLVNIPASASNVITSPAGTVTADSMTDDSVNNRHYAYSNAVSFVSGTTYTVSVFAKAGTATAIQLVFTSTEFGTDEWATFDLANGVVGSKGSGVTGSDAIIQPVGNGWYRCVLTSPCISTGTSPAANIGLVNSNASATRLPNYVGSGQTAYLWGAQVEAQAFASSYIPTTTASVARGADNAVMTGTNFSSWYNQSEGTFLADHDASYSASAASRWVGMVEDTLSNYIDLLRYVPSARWLVFASGSGQVDITASGTTSATVRRVATAYRTDDFAASLNGGSPVTDTTMIVPTVSNFYIGSRAAGFQLNGTIRRIAYWPTRLPDATLQSLTT